MSLSRVRSARAEDVLCLAKASGKAEGSAKAEGSCEESDFEQMISSEAPQAVTPHSGASESETSPQNERDVAEKEENPEISIDPEASVTEVAAVAVMAQVIFSQDLLSLEASLEASLQKTEEGSNDDLAVISTDVRQWMGGQAAEASESGETQDSGASDAIPVQDAPNDKDDKNEKAAVISTQTALDEKNTDPQGLQISTLKRAEAPMKESRPVSPDHPSASQAALHKEEAAFRKTARSNGEEAVKPTLSGLDADRVAEVAAVAVKAQDRKNENKISHESHFDNAPVQAADLAASASLKASGKASGAAFASSAAEIRTVRAQVQEVLQPMIRERRNEANIHLNPPEWGKVDIQIRVEDKHVHITFTAQHSFVKEAIDRSLAELRGAIQADGLQLGDVHVGLSQQEQQAGGEQEAPAERGSPGPAKTKQAGLPSAQTRSSSRGNSLVDTLI